MSKIVRFVAAAPFSLTVTILCSLSAGAVLAFVFDPQLFQLGDNGGYLLLGISFARGQGFTDPSIPGNPLLLWWPMGFPLLIALYYSVAGPAWTALKVLILIILYAALSRFALLISHRLGKTAALAVLVIVCFSSSLHLLSSYLYSETFYTAYSLLLFCAWYRIEKRLSWGAIVLISFAAVYLAMVRDIGLSLPLALALYLALRARSLALSRAAALVPIAATAVYVVFAVAVPGFQTGSLRAFLGFSASHGSFFPLADLVGSSPAAQPTPGVRTILERVIHSAQGYGLTLVPRSLIQNTYDAWAISGLKTAAMAGFSLVVLTGWVASIRKFLLINIYTALYLLVLCSYGAYYLRLIVPIVPFLILYALCGAKVIMRIVPHRAVSRAILVLAWVWVLADNARVTFTNPRGEMPATYDDSTFQECIRWVRDHARPEEVVVSPVQAYMYLVRGGVNVPYHYTTVPNEMISFLEFWRADYVMVPSHIGPYATVLDEIQRLYPQHLTTVRGAERGSRVLAWKRN